MSNIKRGSANSGGDEHITLVQLTTKKIVDTFINLKYIQISYEPTAETIFKIKIEDEENPYGSHSTVAFRPDIILRADRGLKRYSDVNWSGITENWSGITDSRAIIFEIETNPAHIFRNLLKMEAYKRLRKQNRTLYSFVLVCWKNAKLPKRIDPFDEVWTFPRSEGKTT